jgi:hypothetical protein
MAGMDDVLHIYATRHLGADETTPPAQVSADRSAMLLAAFGYALGRRTSAVADVAGVLVDHRDWFSAQQRAAIVERIDEALAGDRAGDPCDAEEWRRVRDVLTGD